MAADSGRRKYGKVEFEEMAHEGRKGYDMAKRRKGRKLPARGKNGRFLRRK